MDRAERVARSFFDAWLEPDAHHIAGFFAEDALFVEPRGQYSGRAEIEAVVAQQIAAIGSVEPEIVTVAGNDDVVLIERIERLEVGNVSLVVEGAVVIELDEAGLITRFRDYHDQAALAAQLEHQANEV